MAGQHQTSDDQTKAKNFEELRDVIATHENQTTYYLPSDPFIDPDDNFYFGDYNFNNRHKTIEAAAPIHSEYNAPETLPSDVIVQSSNDAMAVPAENNIWSVFDSKAGKMRPPRQDEFLRIVVDNLEYASYATWLNKEEGLVEIHQPDELITLWRQVKGRQTDGPTNYESFSKGFRIHYKDGSMIKTHKKHTFRFKMSIFETQ